MADCTVLNVISTGSTVTTSTNGVGDYIARGLSLSTATGTVITTAKGVGVIYRNTSTSASVTDATTSNYSQDTTAITESDATLTWASQLTGTVLAGPNPDVTSTDAVAIQCYDAVATGLSESSLFFAKSNFGKSWSFSTSWTTEDVYHLTSTTEIYPVNPSTYKLCDGSPRVNQRPITSTYTSTPLTSYAVNITVATPTFRSMPCVPKPSDCQ